jgi:chromosome segregation ATPase
MGKKGKTKKAPAQQAPEAVTTSKKVKQASTEKINSEAKIDNSFLSKLDENLLRAQFNAMTSIESSIPEEGIQAARDLFVDVTKIEHRLQGRVNYLRSQQETLNSTEEKYVKRLQSETESVRVVQAQVSQLQTLKNELTKKRDQLVMESEKKADEERMQRQVESENLSKQIAKISAKLEAQGKERMHQAEENDRLKHLLRTELDRYSAAETAFNDKMESYSTKIEERTNYFESESMMLETDKNKCAKYEAQIKGMVESEKVLRNQVNEYAARFESFQEALNTSNVMFAKFKKRIDELTKTIKALEKEKIVLAQKKTKSVETIQGMKNEQRVLGYEEEKILRQITSLNALVDTLGKENEDNRLRIRELESGFSG